MSVPPDISTCRLICVFFTALCVCGACVAGGGLAADGPGPSQGSHFCKNTFLVLIFSFSQAPLCHHAHSLTHIHHHALRTKNSSVRDDGSALPTSQHHHCLHHVKAASPSLRRSANPCSMLPPRTCVPDTPNACSIVLILFPVQEVGGVHRVFSVYAHCGEMLRNISNLHVRFCTCTCC